MIREIPPKYNMKQVEMLGRLFAILEVLEERGLKIKAVDEEGKELTSEIVMDGMLPTSTEVLL